MTYVMDGLLILACILIIAAAFDVKRCLSL